MIVTLQITPHKTYFLSQLRYLQTLNNISAENNSTIIFPFPIDLISSFMTSSVKGPGQEMFRGQVLNSEKKHHEFFFVCLI